jgi:hypothetical protein
VKTLAVFVFRKRDSVFDDDDDEVLIVRPIARLGDGALVSSDAVWRTLFLIEGG